MRIGWRTGVIVARKAMMRRFLRGVAWVLAVYFLLQGVVLVPIALSFAFIPFSGPEPADPVGGLIVALVAAMIAFGAIMVVRALRRTAVKGRHP